MIPSDSKSAATAIAPDRIEALLPSDFVEGLVAPLFAEPARAEAAADLLGAPMAFACARLCRGPALDRELMYHRALFASVQSRRITARAVELIDDLTHHGLPAVAVKGLAAALSAYPHPAYRRVSEVSVVVRDKDLPALAQRLADRGFYARVAAGPADARPEAGFAPLAAPDGAFGLAVHAAVDGRPAIDGFSTGWLFDRSEPVDADGGRVLVPPREYSFAIAALDAVRRLRAPDSLAPLFDACLLTAAFGDRMDWGEVETVARRGGFVRRMVFFRELLAALGAGRPPVFAERGVPTWLVPRIAATVRGLRTLAGPDGGAAQTLALETALLDSPLAALRHHEHRLRRLVARRPRYLPGVPLRR